MVSKTDTAMTGKDGQNVPENIKVIFLVRHAKASLKDGLDDFSRPLCPKGRKQAEGVRDAIAQFQTEPQIVFCSPSVRTSETLDILLPALPVQTEVTFEEFLYLASDAQMLELLKSIGEETNRVMIIAHNPGLENLILALANANKSDNKSYKQVKEKFSPGAVAVMLFNGKWAELAKNSAELALAFRPKDVLGDE
ncbi:MAG: histidine phosphatase family protein [Alphaproteobacteria bacterium]|nr:histidine phosphatase family protein [Alphaproteobacteria bacterium]